MSDLPITLVVRALNAAGTLDQVLGALDRRPGDQLVVVDSGSTDGTLEIARRHGAEVVRLAPGTFTYGRALNAGFAAARNDWVLVLSAHTVPIPPDFLARYRAAIRRFPAEVTAAVGPLVTADFDSPLPGGITLFRQGDFDRGFGFAAGNPNCLYRRDAWQARPFDEALGGGEDLQWYVQALAAGETVAAVHGATVRYLSRQSWRASYRKGRVDYRAAARLIQPHRTGLGGLLIRAAKLVLYAALGRIHPREARNSLAHCLGNWAEARALRRRAG